MKLAEILYFRTFQKELPNLKFKQQDIEYIINQLMSYPEMDVFDSDLLN
ncbi:hypothetical protein [Pseudoneobacillus sp. C159]